MSGFLASQVWKYKLDKTALVVLMALCDIADDDGTSCYPRPRYVAWKTGCSVATIYRLIDTFVAKGVLEHVGYRGETPEYTIHLDKVALKPDYERKRIGRPRKKSSHGEKSFAPREKNRTTQNVSHDEKSRRTMRNVLAPREKFSHGENEEHRLHMPQNEAESGVASKRDVAESILLNQSYDSILEIHDASTKKLEEQNQTAEQSAERQTPPIAPAPPAPPSPPTALQRFTEWLAAEHYAEIPGQRMTPIEKRQYEDASYRRYSHLEVMTMFLDSTRKEVTA